ncbi:MAG: Uma2 family endonuclease [Cuspidothrix sp.]
MLPGSNLITGNREPELNGNLMILNRQTKLGKVFISSTILTLHNGGKRSPDVAWIANERWDVLSIQDQEKFPKICPDFVIELCSRTDSLTQL